MARALYRKLRGAQNFPMSSLGFGQLGQRHKIQPQRRHETALAGQRARLLLGQLDNLIGVRLGSGSTRSKWWERERERGRMSERRLQAVREAYSLADVL
jgi:hypothetical protein